MIKAAVTVLVLCAVLSCSDNTAVMAELDRAEAVMEEYPGSALALLDTLDRSRLVTREARARHALLYSQALDKNYIDLSTDSIINPAVKYYSRHGSHDYRLMTQYYLGRIYQNAGDNESAMRCFVQAERYVPECSDAGMAARLYTAMTAIYYSVYQFEKALTASVNAADYYLSDADTNQYADKMITAANISLLLQDTVKIHEYLSKVRLVFRSISDEEKGYYFGEYLASLPKDSVRLTSTVLDEYLSTVTDPAYQDHINIAIAWYRIGQPDSALSVLTQSESDFQTELRYWLLLAYIWENKNDYNKAYQYLKEYTNLEVKKRQAAVNDDTKYIKEQLKSERRHYRLTISLVASTLATVIITLLAYLLILRSRNARLRAENSCSKAMTEKQAFELMYMELSAEHDTLQKKYGDILADIKGKAMDNDSLRRLITSRMQIFFKLLVSVIIYGRISENTESEIKNVVENKRLLLDNLRQYAALTYPELEQYLTEHGLTEREIDFCNLYLLGLRGKEIGRYLGLARHYTVSSGIRRKLGLGERDVNIDGLPPADYRYAASDPTGRALDFSQALTYNKLNINHLLVLALDF